MSRPDGASERQRSTALPARVAWAIETMDIRPDDRLLEIGLGAGVAIASISELLTSGTITAIDRSAAAIERSRRRNEARIASGTVALSQLPIEEADFPDGSFTKVFAINVNLFWVDDPAPELALIRRLLVPGGTLYLFYEPPSAAQIPAMRSILSERLAEAGLATSTHTVERSGRSMLCVLGRPGPNRSVRAHS